VDISDCFEVKMQAIRCYASQFEGAKAAGEIFPTGRDLYELIRIQSAHYGSLIRAPYGEPYFCYETLEVQDVLQLGVTSL
jgi:LmbE family N-acetylglucosaminyl deacetylase